MFSRLTEAPKTSPRNFCEVNNRFIEQMPDIHYQTFLYCFQFTSQKVLETFNIIGYSFLSGLTTSKRCIRKHLGGGFGSDISRSSLQMQHNAHMSQI